MPTLFVYEGETNDKYTNGDVYGVLGNHWTKIHTRNEWQILSPFNKQDVFLQVGDKMPTNEELTNFAPFRMLHYSTTDTNKQFSIDFIPKDQLIILTDGINVHKFSKIKKLFIDHVSNKGRIYVMVANGDKYQDHDIYYTYTHSPLDEDDTNEWVPCLLVNDQNEYILVDSRCDRLENQSLNNLKKLSLEEFNILEEAVFAELLKSSDTIKLSFLFAPLEKDSQLQIKNVTIYTDLQGMWESTQVGIDYTYAYPDSETLLISFKESGKYKINYLA